MMHQKIGKKQRLYLYIVIFLLLSTLNNHKLVKSDFFNFKISEINVFGLSEKNNLIISDNIKNIITENIFLVKKEFLTETLKKNSLVNSFEIKKIFPNKLNIKIEKTEFLAITNINGQNYFVGSNGKLTKYENTKKSLPYIFGLVNISKFVEFVEVVKISKYNFNSIKEIYFYPSGRWDIKNNDGQLVKLPSENLKLKLDSISLLQKNENFKNARIIDLRFKNKIIVTDD